MGGTRARGSWMFVAVLAGLLAFASSALAKHAGALDRSFGGKGFVLTRPAGHRGYANAVAVGKKDKVIAAGASGGGFGVVRYTRHGKVDSSFGRGGVQTHFGDGNAQAYGVDVGKQGVVVAAGQVCHLHAGCFFAVAKYDSEGRLDKGFGDDGRVELGFGTQDSTATSVAFTRQGKIVVSGYTCRTTIDCDFALAQLLPNGDPDPLFGSSGDGKVVTGFQDPAGDPIRTRASTIAIDSRGRIALSGAPSGRWTLLALYKPRGHLVRSFGHNGKVVKDLPHMNGVEGLAADAKDRIVVVGGDRTKKQGGRWALARFGKGGGLDSSFGNHGSVATGFPGRRVAAALDVAIDSKQRIVVTGTPFFSLARYRPNGKLDKSFGQDGRVTKSHKLGASSAVAIDSRNRPVAAGFGVRPQRFAVARFLG
jgi:uncharacterized delta-60 repeat protein